MNLESLITAALIALVLVAICIADELYLKIEESKTVGLRANPLVMLVGGLFVCAVMLGVVDPIANHDFNVPMGNSKVYFNYYHLIVAIIGIMALGRYINFSTWTDKIAILILGLLFARFMAGWLDGDWEGYGFLYMACFYYIIFNVVYLEPNAYFRLPWVALIGFVLVPLVYFIDQLRQYGFYATYIAVIYMLSLVARYLWNLEFKRRTRCETCSGWGRIPLKPIHTPWWAIGRKETASSKECVECKGKGWKYRYPEYLHN